MSMSGSSDDILVRAKRYVIERDIELERALGFGREAKVFATGDLTAIKVFDNAESFERELLCYLRLTERGIRDVLGHVVPKLLDADEKLLVIEMTIVTRPFLLDFGAARLDGAPDFPAEVLEGWEQEKAEQFGGNWPHVAAILEWVRVNAGIYLLDVHPGNIGFEE
jgi:hypothetical protein